MKTQYKNKEITIFNNVKFRRYPDSESRSERVYYTPGISKRQEGVGYLHQEIWRFYNGPIPDGYHIHHKDKNPLNNSLDNLECLSQTEHSQRHFEDASMRGKSPEKLAHMAAIRPMTKEWHASEVGHEWHKGHGIEAWGKRELHTLVCDYCGIEYTTKDLSHEAHHYHSNACKSAARRASGVDDIDRACVTCGELFKVNKYATKKHCDNPECKPRAMDKGKARKKAERLTAEQLQQEQTNAPALFD